MATTQTPWDDTQKQEFLQSHGYNQGQSQAMINHVNPQSIQQTPTFDPPPAVLKGPVKSGAAMTKTGVAVNPDTLEKLRAAGDITDDSIADQMAASSTHFAKQLKKVRIATGGDPAATTALLNTRFYGDTQYNPVSQTTGDVVSGAPVEAKPRNLVSKALDLVYGEAKKVKKGMEQSAYDVLGEGGVMQQYNRGQISAPQAAFRSAVDVYHGATSPVVTPFMDINKTLADKTGVTSLIQSGIEGVQNSELGQDVAPYVKGAIEGYQNLPQDSYLRDLAAAGQAGLDTLSVVGAQSELDLAKRAVAQAMHPFQTIRHPINSAKQVLTGKAPAQEQSAPQVESKRVLTGSAKKAVDKGMDEKFMEFVADQNSDTRAAMAKMTDAAHQGSGVLGGTVKHKEILGGQMLENEAYILDQKKTVGQALKAMKDAVADDVVNLSDDYSNFLQELANKGAVINEKGKIISLAGAADDNIPLLQQTLDFLRPDDIGNVVHTGKEIDMWRAKMFEEMNSARAKLQPSVSGQSTLGFAEKLTNDIRRSSLVSMAKGNTNMIAANDAYEELATQSSKFLKSIGYKGGLNVDAITAKQLRAGEVALRTLGNASADTRDAFQSVIDTARKYGRVSNVDDMALVRYADALEDVFPITPTRSLGGAVSRATKDSLGNVVDDVAQQAIEKKGLVRGMIGAADKKALDAWKFMRGQTPENQFNLLMEVLNAPPDTPFFTVVQNALPDSVAAQAPKDVTAGDLQTMVNSPSTTSQSVGQTPNQATITPTGSPQGSPGMVPPGQARSGIEGMQSYDDIINQGDDIVNSGIRKIGTSNLPEIGKVDKIDIPISQLHSIDDASFFEKNILKGETSKTKGEIWITQTPDGQNLILDGNFRAYEALRRGEKTIKAAFVPLDDVKWLDLPEAVKTLATSKGDVFNPLVNSINASGNTRFAGAVGKPLSKIPNTEGFVYHATTAERAADIIKNGLQPVDGKIFFAPSPDIAAAAVGTTNASPVILKIPVKALGKAFSDPNVSAGIPTFYTTSPVSSKGITFLP